MHYTLLELFENEEFGQGHRILILIFLMSMDEWFRVFALLDLDWLIDWLDSVLRRYGNISAI